MILDSIVIVVCRRHKLCTYPKFENCHRYRRPTPFFKLGIAMEKCRAKNLFEKGVKNRCEIGKKGMKTPMQTIYILVAFK